MELEVINSMAKREVLKTSRFTRLIKSGNCRTYKRTQGDTSHSVDAIKQISYKFISQTEKLAKELLGKNLAETVNNNFTFLYSHFQYEADPELQQMRSPICSWSDRFKGIDCKSFSIIASTLLLNQGIGHFIRRIKQKSYQPNHWTHVYIVVPVDQKNLSLDKGYYVIDATTHSNKEGEILEKEDTLMSLPHAWLNGTSQTAPLVNNEGVAGRFTAFLQVLANNGVSETVIAAIHKKINTYLSVGEVPTLSIDDNKVYVNENIILLQKSPYLAGSDDPSEQTTISTGSEVDLEAIFNDIDLSEFNIAGLFNGSWSFNCFNGTYNQDDLNYSTPLIIDGFSQLYKKFNEALLTTNALSIQFAASDILVFSRAFQDHTLATADYDWSSNCSKSVTRAFKSMGYYYLDIAYTAFLGYLSTYFVYDLRDATTLNTSYPFNTRGSVGLDKTAFQRLVSSPDKPKGVWELQFKGVDVPFFEITDYVVTQAAKPSFNLDSFLNTLSNTALQFQQGSSTPNGSNNNNVNLPSPTISKAGFGLIPGLLLTGVAATGIYYAINNNSKKSKKNV